MLTYVAACTSISTCETSGKFYQLFIYFFFFISFCVASKSNIFRKRAHAVFLFNFTFRWKVISPSSSRKTEATCDNPNVKRGLTHLCTWCENECEMNVKLSGITETNRCIKDKWKWLHLHNAWKCIRAVCFRPLLLVFEFNVEIYVFKSIVLWKKKKQMYFITMALQPVLMIIVNLIVGLENLAPNSILHRIFKLRRWQTTVFARRRKKTSNLLARHSTEFTLCVNVFYQSARCFGKWQKDKAVFSWFHFESSNPAHVFFAMESEISSGSTSST